MNELTFKNILALSPHTDDVELGAGGTLSRFITAGSNVNCVAFSSCDNELIVEEFDGAMYSLGVTNHTLREHQRRYFQRDRQSILDYMIELRKVENYDLVLIPSSYDMHQDHAVIHREAIRAFKHTTIIGYELPWNCISFKADLVVALDKINVWYKINALEHYKTQKERPYFDEYRIKCQMISRGVQIDSDYAEAFEIIRMIL